MKLVPRIDPFTRPAVSDGWFLHNGAVMMYADKVLGFGSLAKHTISADGVVTPSVLITGVDSNCNLAEYHEFVTLLDYADALKGEGG